jgi:hypothetical protein
MLCLYSIWLCVSCWSAFLLFKHFGDSSSRFSRARYMQSLIPKDHAVINIRLIMYRERCCNNGESTGFTLKFFFGYVDLKKKSVDFPSVMYFEGRLASGPEEICDLFAEFTTNIYRWCLGAFWSWPRTNCRSGATETHCSSTLVSVRPHHLPDHVILWSYHTCWVGPCSIESANK